MAHQVSLETHDVVEGVVDHLLHISYDQRTALRLTATTGDEESITALGKALFGVQPGGKPAPARHVDQAPSPRQTVHGRAV